MLFRSFMRTLVDSDLVWQVELIVNASVGKGTALVEAKQTRPRRLGFDNESQVVQPVAIAGRNHRDGSFHETVKLARGQHHLTTL